MARQMGERRGDEPLAPADEFALLNALYWTCVNVADARPLLMVLDDAQWADGPSLHFVEFTCRRLEQLPFLFVVASRPPDEHSPAPLISLLAEPAVQRLAPSPLSAGAVDRLVRDRIDAAADPAFTDACHEVTGGNPFLLGELVHELVAEGVPASAAAAARVRAIGPRGIARVVLLRLRRLPDGARRLAAAVSVAADGMTLSELAKLAGLDQAAAAEAAASLEAVEIIDPRGGLRFTHPVVRAAVYEDLPAVQRARLHLHAAELQRARGRPAPEVAEHLLHVDAPVGEWAVAALHDAAREVTSAGDFAAAERLLERALREPVERERRAELVAELGSAQARTGNPDGARHLEQAAAMITDPERSAAASIELANVLKFSMRADEAAGVLLAAIERLRPAPEAIDRRLHAELLGVRFISPVAGAGVQRELAALALPADDPRDLLDSFLLAAAAFDAVAALAPARKVIALGRRALAGEVVPDDPALGGQALIVATVALIWAEDFDHVYRRFTRALADARAAGSALAVGNSSTMRAMCCYRSGRLLEAEADAATVLELAPQVAGLQTLLAPAVAYAVLSGLDRDVPLEDLHETAFDPALDAAAGLLPFTQLAWARGELCLARQEWELALRHFMDCDRPDPGFGAANPAMVPWREGAAQALLRLGEEGPAVELAAEAEQRARAFAAPRAHGVALRAAGLVAAGEQRIERLTEAVAVLERAGAPLELARAMCDLGAALRAAGRRTDAQAVLEQARHRATALGAARIAARAADELTAAGVRPRREPALGLAALTPSERRVAELAAAGATNREIAQSLFVTEKTVETHLGHVYDKVGVRSRRQLPDALRPQAA
jgi:DNA-binding CsgD family transcriptional regulator